MNLTMKQWRIASSLDRRDTDALMDVLLKSRDVVTEQQREVFVLDGDGVWHDPFLFNDMKKAVDIICDTADKGGKIVIYGDYDCDGVTATSILVRYFRSIGCNVDYAVPHRAEHGYGLTENILDKVLGMKPDLLITVDCGITNMDTVDVLMSKGIRVIVSDHHTVKDEIPRADAVICAKRLDNTYPFIDLCGAGVALKIVEAMGRDGRYRVTPSVWKGSIELAGLATIADLVSVVDENRTIIKKAFKSMENPVNPGVRIMNRMILDPGKKLDETFISFNFVPRINAAGRLYDSSDALNLFLQDDEEEVRKAAVNLGRQNEERKRIESEVFSQAVEQVESTKRPDKWKLINTRGPIVVYGRNWHQGVLGIVAGKLSQYFRRSAIVFTDDPLEPENVKGSGRAYGDYDLFGSLGKISDKCVNFGGHRKAAGLVVAKKRMGEFMEALEELSQGTETAEDEGDILDITVRIPFEQLTLDTYRAMSVLRPFGIGNTKPVFATEGLLVTEVASMSEGAHIRLTLKKKDGTDDTTVSAVGFGMGLYLDMIKPGDVIDAAYTMNEYTFKNNTSLSLHLEDIRPGFEDTFLWNKYRIAEDLFRQGMDLTQIVKMGSGTKVSDMIPDQQCYVRSYQVLSGKCGSGVSTADIRLLTKFVSLNAGVELNPFTMRRCLQVFCEAGLIELSGDGSDTVSFSIVKLDRRADLKNSSMYMRLKQYG